MKATKPRPCGNPKCSISTDIMGYLTFGSGELSFLGYWEKPCLTCEKEWVKKGNQNHYEP
jgi:hypothetical protein